MSDLLNFRVETPKNLDSIFSLDCFKYNEMKGLFKDIYAYLTKFGLKMDDLYAKMASIPDFSALTKSIKDLERKLADLEKKVNLNKEEYDENKLLVVEREERIREEFTDKFLNLEDRMCTAEKEMVRNL